METYIFMKGSPGHAIGTEISLDPADASAYLSDGSLLKKDAAAVAEVDKGIDKGLTEVASTILSKLVGEINTQAKATNGLNMFEKQPAEPKDKGSLGEYLWAMAGNAQTMDPRKAVHCKGLLINKYECKINDKFGEEWSSTVNKGAGGFGRTTDANGQSTIGKASVQQEGIGALGGFTVPIQYANEFFRLADPMSIFMSRCKRYTMTGKQLMIPALDYSLGGSGKSPYLGGMNATWTAENTGFSQQNMQVRQIELNANLLAGYTQSSRTLLADSAVSLEQVMTGLFAEAIAFNVDFTVFNGTGVGQPKGMIASGACKTFSRGVWNTSGLLLKDMAIADSYLIPEREGEAIVLVPPSFKQRLYVMSDASGKVVWLPQFPPSPSGVAALRPTMSVFGKPVFWSQLPAASESSGSLNFLIPSFYALGIRDEIEIAVSEHFAFTTNLLTWRFLFRGDGQSLLNTTLTLQNGDVVAPFVSVT